MRRFLSGTLLVLVLVIGAVLTLTGCTTTVGSTQRAAWSHQTIIPNKDYKVIGAVVVRSGNILTMNADLMDKAIAMGGHDIINVRVDILKTSDGVESRVGGSAVVIVYTDETLVEKSSYTETKTTTTGNTVTAVPVAPSTTTTTATTTETETLYGGTSSGSTIPLAAQIPESSGRKKFLGIF